MNVVDFEINLMKSLIGPNLAGVPYSITDHKLMHLESRWQCDYCVMFGKSKRPRFECGETSWNVPLCSLGSGVSEDGFSDRSHSKDQILWETHAKYVQMKSKTNKQCN